MSFALPSAFWLLACTVPIVVFYILKVRLRRQAISTNLFWKQIYDEKPPRSIWQFLRHMLSLFAQLLLLLLLVLAVADPHLPWELLQARRIVLVIDRSASMRAADVLPSRFEAARNAAAAVIEGLRYRDQLAIVAAGPQPEVVVGMSSHVPTLKRALDKIAVTDTPTDLTPAVAIGKQLVGNQPHGEVLVYTDGCTAQPVAELNANPSTDAALATVNAPPTPLVQISTFGTKASNVGITQFQVRRSLVDPLGYESLVAVSNAAVTPVDCRLELELEGVPVDVVPLHLKAGEKWRRSLPKTSLDGGKFTAKLTQIEWPHADASDATKLQPIEDASITPTPNALTVDDTAWAVLAPRNAQPVLLVTAGNLFLQKVLEANPLVKCTVVKEPPTSWPADTTIVLHRQVPAELPPGDVLIIEPTGNTSAWDIGDTIENPLITQQTSDSPLMAHVRLDNVLLPSARRITFKTPPDILAGAITGEPIYAAVKRDKGKCLVLSVDLDQSDLAFRTAFPIMVTNALNWFRGTSGELESAVATGQLVHMPQLTDVPANAKFVMRSPTGSETPLNAEQLQLPTTPTSPTTDNEKSKAATSQPSPTAVPANSAGSSTRELTFGPFDECGLWTLVKKDATDQTKDTVVHQFAANLANEHETDLRPHQPPDDTAIHPAVAAGWFARPLWFYLAACACVLTITEWVLHQRRVIT
ncbi:MAG: VWA domain-containing protein [Pirellulales bacterium]